MSTEIITIDPVEFGIEQSKAIELVGNLPQIQQERDILAKLYDQVVLEDIENPETSKKAREIRLKIKDNRTKGLEVWHKNTKEVFLRGGQFIDAIKKKEAAENTRMEDALESIEKYAENKEKERKAKLNTERISQLEPFNAFVPIGLNFGEISEEEFAKVYNGAKLQFEQQQEQDKKAEAERLRKIEIDKLHVARKEELLTLWQFIEDKESNFGEMTEELFTSIKSVAVAQKADYEAEQDKIRKENLRLAKEKLALEEKAKKKKADDEAKAKLRAKRTAELSSYLVFIRDYNGLLEMNEEEYQKNFAEIKKGAEEHWQFELEERNRKAQEELEKEKKAAAEIKAQEDKLKAEQAEKEKLEAELKAKKDAEAKAEQERLAEIERQKEEAEKLAKAPVKKQLSLWVASFTIPETKINNEKAEIIKVKFDAFKSWAQKEIETI